MIHVFVRVLQFMALFCAGFLVTAAQAADLATQWQGAYGYGDSRAPVPFTFTLNVNGGAVSGRITEPATHFGNGTSSNLYANISGSTDGTHISFTKTYDGHGGQTHSVSYSGTIGSDGASMSGSWQLPAPAEPGRQPPSTAQPGIASTPAANSAPRTARFIGTSRTFATTLSWSTSANSPATGITIRWPSTCRARGNAAMSLGLRTQGPYKVSPRSERAIPCSP